MKLKHIFAIFAIILILFPLSHSQGTDLKRNDLTNKPSVIWMKKTESRSFTISENYIIYHYYSPIIHLIIVSIVRADNGKEVCHINNFSYAKVHNNSIYLPRSENIYCYGIDGKRKWNVSLDWLIYGFIFTSAGIAAYHINPAMFALISYDGKIIMEREWKTLALATYPVASGNIIYFDAYNVTNHSKTYLYAVSTNGSVIWNITTSDFENKEPVKLQIYNETIYETFVAWWGKDRGKYSVYAISQRGEILWDVKGHTKKNAPGIALLRVTNKSIYILLVGFVIYLQKINRTTGQAIVTSIYPKWFPSSELIDFDSSNNLYVGCEDKLYSYTENGTERWNLSLDSLIAEIRVYNNSIYALTDKGFLYKIGTPPEFSQDIYTIIIPIFVVLGLLILGIWGWNKKEVKDKDENV